MEFVAPCLQGGMVAGAEEQRSRGAEEKGRKGVAEKVQKTGECGNMITIYSGLMSCRRSGY
jgi:hypothetical protein